MLPVDLDLSNGETENRNEVVEVQTDVAVLVHQGVQTAAKQYLVESRSSVENPVRTAAPVACSREGEQILGRETEAGWSQLGLWDCCFGPEASQGYEQIQPDQDWHRQHSADQLLRSRLATVPSSPVSKDQTSVESDQDQLMPV